jgi:hypothetical protein
MEDFSSGETFLSTEVFSPFLSETIFDLYLEGSFLRYERSVHLKPNRLE